MGTVDLYTVGSQLYKHTGNNDKLNVWVKHKPNIT